MTLTTPTDRSPEDQAAVSLVNDGAPADQSPEDQAAVSLVNDGAPAATVQPIALSARARERLRVLNEVLESAGPHSAAACDALDNSEPSSIP